MSKLTIIFSALLIFAGALFGQDTKIGYVQVEMLMQDFPEWEDASKTYEKELQSWQTELNELQGSIQSMEEEYQQRAMLYSPERQQEEQQKILEKRQEAVKFYQDIFGEGGQADQRKMELLTPIYDKINRAINILGEREGYTMIFNAQGLLYAKEEFDITPQVLEVLKSGVPSSSAGSGSGGGSRR